MLSYSIVSLEHWQEETAFETEEEWHKNINFGGELHTMLGACMNVPQPHMGWLIINFIDRRGRKLRVQNIVYMYPDGWVYQRCHPWFKSQRTQGYAPPPKAWGPEDTCTFVCSGASTLAILTWARAQRLCPLLSSTKLNVLYAEYMYFRRQLRDDNMACTHWLQILWISLLNSNKVAIASKRVKG